MAKDQYLNRTQILRKSNLSEPWIEKEHPECNQPDSRAICRYLKAFSKTGDHGDVCLAHLFTYYDFDTGILGLAHIGKHEGSSMGICAGGKRDENKAFLNTGENEFKLYFSFILLNIQLYFACFKGS